MYFALPLIFCLINYANSAAHRQPEVLDCRVQLTADPALLYLFDNTKYKECCRIIIGYC